MADDRDHGDRHDSSEESVEIPTLIFDHDESSGDSLSERQEEVIVKEELGRMFPKLFVEKQYKDQVEKIVWGDLTAPKTVYKDLQHGGVVLEADKFTLRLDTTQCGWQKHLIEAVHVLLKPTIHILILGEPIGLEEDLVKDFALVAKQADLKAEDFFPVSEETEQSVCTSEGMCVLLYCPTVQHLTESLNKYILSYPADNIKIYYSGHSTSNGDWWLGEDNFFSGTDLKQVIADAQKQRKFDGTIVVLINSCYGLKFVQNACDFNDDTVQTFVSSISTLIQKQRHHDPKLKDIGIAACKFLVRLLAADSEDEIHSPSDEIRKAASTVFTKIMHEKYRHSLKVSGYGEEGIGFPVVFSELSEFTYLLFRLIPFSLESLDARGALLECFGVSCSDEKAAKESGLLRLITEPPDLVRNLTSPLAPAVQPTIYAFPAGFGDSTLIRYDGINILIDGGIYSIQPCFWPVVSRLPAGEKLDVVILTHQDEDHLNGIRALIKRAPDDFIGALYCLDPPPPGTVPNSKATYGGIEVWDKAVERKVAKKLQPCCIPFKDRADIKLCILAPNESDARNAQNCMKRRIKSRAIGGLTAPNIASAVVYLGIKKGDRTYRALFTGDAHSSTVVDAIKNAEQLSEPEVLDLSFDYIDVPHHGSKTNDPNDLFKSVKKCDVAVISTNGARHGHPDKSTLDHLGKQMRMQAHDQPAKIGKIGFTYREHKVYKDRKEQREQRNWIHTYSQGENLQDNFVYAKNTFSDEQTNQACLKVVLNHEGDHSISSEDISTTL